MSTRPIFSSRFATILTMIGVAVGLGNVWRFPYMMGKFGGSAFLLIYLFFTFLFAIPALMGEVALGKYCRQGPVGSFRKALGNFKGKVVGLLLLVTILVASSYYAVVITNVMYTSYFSVFHGFTNNSIDLYINGLQNGAIQYGIAAVVILASLAVIHRGLSRGIEWISKIFVPFFLIVILFLIYHAMTLEDAYYHLVEFLKPDFSSLKPIDIFAALGQSIYSLSLGGTFMVVYGSYIDQKESIPRIACWTAFGDVGAAFLTSLFIIPAILVFGLDMASGPTLLFSTLPHLFAQVPLGQLVGSLFLIALSMVAFLSLVAALEVANTCLSELRYFQNSRIKILIIIGLIELFLAFPCAFDADLIGRLDLIFGSGMQVLGSGLALIALTWGLGKVVTKSELGESFIRHHFHVVFAWMKWVVPIVLFLILFGYIYSVAMVNE